MFAIEFFVGTARGAPWVRGRRRYASREAADAVIRDDWQNEARKFTGVFVRRAAPA